MWAKPSLELCKSIIMLRDSNISGRLSMKDLPALLNMLLFWKVWDSTIVIVVITFTKQNYICDSMIYYAFIVQAAFLKWDKGKHGKTSSYNLRSMLWEAGVGVSNKVLECLVLRFARDAILTSESFVLAMLRLHLAHG